MEAAQLVSAIDRVSAEIIEGVADGYSYDFPLKLRGPTIGYSAHLVARESKQCLELPLWKERSLNRSVKGTPDYAEILV
jgi:hypothetical protein